MNPTEQIIYRYLQEWLDGTYEAFRWPFTRRIPFEKMWNEWDLGKQMRELAAIADGAAPTLPLEEITAGCDLLVRISNGDAVISAPTWWSTPIGKIVLEVRLALSGDQLITSSEAAEIIGIDLPILNLLVNQKRVLQGYALDAGIEKNPQRRMRFMRTDVEAYARRNPPTKKRERKKGTRIQHRSK